ncbi:MAG: serine/threonine-protein kinase [Candidatus Obscuribacter sp.]|nr:serine/threonine-protein kinase [Candidatus Obscuribacter sp.]
MIKRSRLRPVSERISLKEADSVKGLSLGLKVSEPKDDQPISNAEAEVDYRQSSPSTTLTATDQASPVSVALPELESSDSTESSGHEPQSQDPGCAELSPRQNAILEKLCHWFSDDKNELLVCALYIAITALTLQIIELNRLLFLLILFGCTTSLAYLSQKQQETFTSWSKTLATIWKARVENNRRLHLKAALILIGGYVLKELVPVMGIFIVKDNLSMQTFFSSLALRSVSVLSVAIVSGLALSVLTKHQSRKLRAGVIYNLVLITALALTVAFVGAPALGMHEGLAAYTYNWLLCSLDDAGVYHGQPTGQAFFRPHFNLQESPYFTLTQFSILFTIVFYLCISRPAAALAQTLAHWVTRGAGKADGILYSITQCLGTQKHSLIVRAAHPAIKHVMQTLTLLALSYGILYWLVAYCPGELGLVIRNWLSASFTEARITSHSDVFSGRPELLHFIAGTIALWCAAPLAVMLLPFTPTARPQLMELFSWGFSYQTLLSRLPLHFAQPMHFWEDIREVSLSGPPPRIGSNGRPLGKDRRKLTLKLKDGGKLCFRLSQISPSDQRLLLTALDEQAPLCTFGDSVLEHQKLLAQTIQANNSKQANDAPKSARRQTALSAKRNYTSTTFQPLAAGSSIEGGNIRIIRQLSSKPLSAVYLVRAEGKLAILKQFALPAQSERVKDLLNGFERECRILETLQDKNISKVLKTFSWDNSHFLLLDYIPGTDLLTLTAQREPFGEIEIRRLAREIAVLMLKLHRHEPQILHRDLTPDNLVITNDGNLALIDFGSAHQFVEGITGTLVGKQAYIAPEQLRGKATIQSDIYSFGCCLYFLATGKEPQALKECDAIADGAGITPSLNELIKCCTSFEATERPESFEEVLMRLGLESSREGKL